MIELLLENSTTILALAATGVFAGLLAGLLGVGGGMIIVPVLFFLFQGFGVSADSAMVIATATSLATIVPTSLSSINAHRKKGNVDFQLLKFWGGFVIIGVLLGSWLVTITDGEHLTILFGIIASLSALNMLFRTNKSVLFESLPGKPGQAGLASITGTLSTMIGIGGGTLSVPILTSCNYPAHKAVGTSAAIGLFISLPGALSLLFFASTPTDAPVATLGYVNFLAFLCIVPLTVACAPMGAALAHKLDAAKLKKIFAIVLFITGLRMLAQFIL